MKKIIFILISFLILLGCDKDDIPKCEVNNTCNIEIANNSDYFIQVAIAVWKEEPPYYYIDLISVDIKPFFIEQIDNMVPGEQIIIKDIPTGYTMVGYDDGFSDIFSWNFYNKLITVNCKTYTLDIKDINF